MFGFGGGGMQQGRMGQSMFNRMPQQQGQQNGQPPFNPSMMGGPGMGMMSQAGEAPPMQRMGPMGPSPDALQGMMSQAGQMQQPTSGYNQMGPQQNRGYQGMFGGGQRVY